MTLYLDSSNLNRFFVPSNSRRDWCYLLSGFFALIILAVILNLLLNRYLISAINYPGPDFSPTTPVMMDQESLAKIMEIISIRELEYQAILTKPKIFSDPSI